MANVFDSQKTEQLFKKLEPTQEVRLLDYGFSVAIQNGYIYAANQII